MARIPEAEIEPIERTMETEEVVRDDQAPDAVDQRSGLM